MSNLTCIQGWGATGCAGTIQGRRTTSVEYLTVQFRISVCVLGILIGKLKRQIRPWGEGQSFPLNTLIRIEDWVNSSEHSTFGANFKNTETQIKMGKGLSNTSLPVQARLVRQAEGRSGGQVARLVREVVLLPGARLSLRALYDELGAAADSSHGAKQTVGVGDLWSNRLRTIRTVMLLVLWLREQ